MVAKVLLVLLVSGAVIAGAIVGYSAIDQLPLRRDLIGQIVEGCLRAAVIATAGTIIILLVRRAYRW